MIYEQDRVSLVIPVYNRENVIEECIRSVFAQSHHNFEIIIVDDGSSDNTYSICEKLAAKDSRIKLYASEHVGVSAARNIALSHVSGEYVFFLDSDDVIHPFLLETLVVGMKKNNASIGATDVFRIMDQNWHKVKEKLAEHNFVGEITSHTADEVIDAAFNHPSPLGCIGGVMMRRDLIADTKFHTGIYIGEDFYFIYKNIIKGATGVFLKQKWYFVRNHASNTSWDYSFNGFWTRFYRRKLVWEREESFGRTRYANREKNAAFGCATLCMERSKPRSKDGKWIRKTLKEYRKALFPAFGFKSKILYLAAIYFPELALWVLRIRKQSEIRKKRKRA